MILSRKGSGSDLLLALTRLVLHHTPDVLGVVREMARVTRAGGKLRQLQRRTCSTQR